MFLVSPRRAQSVQLRRQRGQPLLQLGVELLELMSKAAQLRGIDNGLRHGGMFRDASAPRKTRTGFPGRRRNPTP
jgi:hypothetical protein